MHSRFYLSLLLVASVVVIVFMWLATDRELSTEYENYQAEYKDYLVKNAKDEDARKRAARIETGIRQVYIPALKKADRCTSCHIGVENPMMAGVGQPFTTHSGNYLKNHPVAKFGCTICHYGQGRATNKKEAHGGERGVSHWDYPVIPGKYVQSACGRCHDYKMLADEGMETIVLGEKLFREKGCLGCHKVNGTGGDLGKALDGIGSAALHYFSMGHVKGDLTAYNWIKQHFDDPRAIVPTSEMKVTVSEEEAVALTTYIFSMRADEVPSKYKLVKNLPVMDRDGASLFQMYCGGCHGDGQTSIYDEVFGRTIPAITGSGFVNKIDDTTLRIFIEEGRPGTQMTAWKSNAAGLKKEEIDKIIGHTTKNRSGELQQPFNFREFTSDVGKGKALYTQRCAFCHGDDGKGGGRKLGINLKNETVQKMADPEFLAMTVRDGRKDTPMPGFGPDGEGLSEQDIADVVGYVKTFGRK
ncbi:MAG: c-type cytochrome [Thermodesulfobacteriota bacterium]